MRAPEPPYPGADWLTEPCAAPDEAYRARALARQGELTKPPGSLGRLEDVAVTLAALQRRDHPAVERVPVLVFAGDHGVTAQGVSAYPSEVTVQMLTNFRDGGAAIAVLSRTQGLPLHVVDVGSASREPVPGIVTDKAAHGTADFTAGPAMTEAEVAHALGAGRRALDRVLDEVVAADGAPADLLVLGEMGIGNTTAAAALACALAGLPTEQAAGLGTGLDDGGRQRKREVLEKALARHTDAVVAAGLSAALEALRRVGGLEIAALAGAMVTAAQRGVPVLVDGFIVTSAALVAARHHPGVRPWLLFSHRSAERGHGDLLRALEARPLLDLDLRLGEGTGAALALPLVRAACALHAGMATFAEAAVSGPRP